VEQAIETRELSEAVNPDILVVLHGGPLENPGQVDMVMRASGCPGFIGASTMERLPTEVAMTAQTKAFKAISF